MLNINNGFHWCIVNFCMKQSWLNEMGPRAGRAQQQRALSHRWLAVSHSLFSPCCTWNSPGRYSPVSARRRSPGESPGCSRWGSRGLLTASCWRCVWQKGLRSNGTSQSSVSVLNFLSRVGGGLWGEEREGGHSEGGCRDLRVFSVMVNMVVHLSDARQQSLSEHTTCCLFARGLKFESRLKLARNTNKTPHDARGPGWAQWRAVCTSASASAVDQSESSRPDNGRLAPLCCCQPGEQSDLEWLQRSGERLARSAHVSVSEALSGRRALLWSTCTNRRLRVKHDGKNYNSLRDHKKSPFSWPVSPISNVFYCSIITTISHHD